MADLWGGISGLTGVLARATRPDEDDSVFSVLEMRDREKAVRVGSTFDDWAVILQHKRGSAWFCTHCPKVHSCRHIVATRQQPAAQPEMTLNKQDFERKLEKDYNIVQGLPATATKCWCLLLIA